MASLMHQEFPTLSGHGRSQTNNERSQPAVIPRRAYQMCHIELLDHPRPVAAIAYENRYYSLFKAGQSAQEAQALADRLRNQNEQIAITKLPTGYAVWVLEPDAHRRSPGLSSFSAVAPAMAPPRTTPSAVSSLKDSYVPCHVRVPQQSDRLPAICIGNTYYSLFRIVTRLPQATQICDKLGDRGYKVVITRMVRGYALWVWEPDAVLDSSTATDS